MYLYISIFIYHGSWTESNGFSWRVSLSVAKPGGCGRGGGWGWGSFASFRASRSTFPSNLTFWDQLLANQRSSKIGPRMKPAQTQKIKPLGAQRLTFMLFSMTLGNTFVIILCMFSHTAKNLVLNNSIILQLHLAFPKCYLFACNSHKMFFFWGGHPHGLHFSNFMLLFYRKVKFRGPLRPL